MVLSGIIFLGFILCLFKTFNDCVSGLFLCFIAICCSFYDCNKCFVYLLWFGDSLILSLLLCTSVGVVLCFFHLFFCIYLLYDDFEVVILLCFL